MARAGAHVVPTSAAMMRLKNVDYADGASAVVKTTARQGGAKGSEAGRTTAAEKKQMSQLLSAEPQTT